MTPRRAEFVGAGRWGTLPLQPPACLRPSGGCPRNRQPVQPPTRPMRPLPWRRCGVGPPLRDAGGGLRSSALSLPPRWPSPRGAGRASWRPPPAARHPDIPDRVRAVAAAPMPPRRGRPMGGQDRAPVPQDAQGVRSRASRVHALVDAPLSIVSGERPARHEREGPVPLQKPTPPPPRVLPVGDVSKRCQGSSPVMGGPPGQGHGDCGLAKAASPRAGAQ